ncbi:hypothetical protein PP7435_CHR1-0285 [Komagataella phaffii CBS 7435]|uniref:RlpA-like protein double-psi beta-barrel domain-containing protein n=2 Tax=Komagataella phaffii TaxID=460519 RepID=C4QVS2_KOMPG|nr:Hypothetical protein PAS_chr1-3_0280 [Komagataella phaffii GS115]AOA61105.1 GQ67_02545T0 [Komagataella phaffii]CAH2446002.1 hypothetical protein BQ9382_C1-1485 [Komagataella phaffii CBS 7435]AOA65756.1 GQ68_02703T0 [Komagataella phaffii GS115]CAY67345.1 Hypothetical protein PAS_chr1-3_0280 [Komagataella phaffii GS115]CCA36446.1 hypothetical protein PP7435_CHR1-0285 [Komagataella phaffii CBS 7435]
MQFLKTISLAIISTLVSSAVGGPIRKFGNDSKQCTDSSFYHTLNTTFITNSTSTRFNSSSLEPTEPSTTVTVETSASSSEQTPVESSSGSETTGRGTFYNVSADACGTSHTNADDVVAIAQSLYESLGVSNEYVSTACGRYINASYGGKSVRVQVVDACASCSENDLDFSPSAFQKLADPELGVIQVTWSFE